MIAHQAIRMRLPTGLLAGPAQRLPQRLSVFIILEDRLPPIPADRDMLHGSGLLDAQSARHAFSVLRVRVVAAGTTRVNSPGSGGLSLFSCLGS